MKVGILGSGMVGQAIGKKLVELGHEVCMGSRTADSEKGAEFVSAAGEAASQGTFADAADFGEWVVHCASGGAALQVIEAAGPERLAGKVLMEISNPLDFSDGFPPKLSVCSDDSLAEQIQRAAPEAKVVKTLNTINADVMVDAGRVPGNHVVFVCGEDADAKKQVESLLREGFGWKEVVDLGGLDGARGTEGYLLLWTRLYQALGTGNFNIQINRGD
jgi:predicted dinucleotide-binding enzyme